jgi:hypothetical protein
VERVISLQIITIDGVVGAVDIRFSKEKGRNLLLRVVLREDHLEEELNLCNFIPFLDLEKINCIL